MRVMRVRCRCAGDEWQVQGGRAQAARRSLGSEQGGAQN